MSSASSTPQSGPGKDSSDGRGLGGELVTPDDNSPRFVYYRLYTSSGSISSNNPIHATDPSIGRTLPKLITPPHTASSVKKHLCNIEGISGMTSTLFESLSSQTAIEETSRLSLRGSPGPGLSEDDPIVLVISGVDENLSRRLVSLEGIPEARHANPRYVYYRFYQEVGAVASKTSFDSEDFSLGRINILSVAPPRTVASLESRVMQAEDLSFLYDVQLFKDIDGEVPMNGDDPVCHPQACNYPGCVADEPITIICERGRFYGSMA